MSDAFLLVAVLLGLASVVCAVMAAVGRDLLRCVIAFALSSAFLSALFFRLGAAYAGAFELTVGAGLVTVLFLVALVLAGREEEASA